MAVTPETELKLLKCPLTLNNKNQLTFKNKEEQFNYFNNLEKLTIEDVSYQRKDSTIAYPDHIDSILQFNYCMYKNSNYGDKWFYAFITDMTYINDGLTYIKIATDTWQTWQFDIVYNYSFIERQMIDVANDIPGNNVLPEGLEIGELVTGGTAEFDDLEPIPAIAYIGDEYPGLNGVGVFKIDYRVANYNGIPSAVTYFFFADYTAFNLFMYSLSVNNLAEKDFSDKVITAFTIPKFAVRDLMIPANLAEGYKLNNVPVYVLKQSASFKQPEVQKTLIATPNNLDGYVPRNQKLRTYPYLYVAFNPTNGSSKIFRYEDFANGTPKFNMISEINPNPTVAFIPQNYRKANGDSLSDITSLSGYPTLSNRVDFFNSWISQNGNIIKLSAEQEQFNYEINAIKGGADMLGSMFSMGKGDSGAFGGFMNSAIGLSALDKNHEFYIKQQMAQIEKQKLVPDKVNMGTSNATLLGYNKMDKNIFTRYSIKHRQAELLDKYFDMYGYQTNDLQMPSINNRPNWNYIKTQGCNITGDIPQEDLQSIKIMFDNGLTLWHHPSTYLNYSVGNR